MDHIRLDAEYGQDDECEIIVRRDHHALTGSAGMFICYPVQDATGVDRFVVLRRGKNAAILRGTNGNVEVAIVRGSHGFRPGVAEEEADDDAFGLVFNRGNAGVVNFIVRLAVYTEHRKAVRVVIVPGGRVADAEACRVLDDDPSEHQARYFDDANQNE